MISDAEKLRELAKFLKLEYAEVCLRAAEKLQPAFKCSNCSGTGYILDSLGKFTNCPYCNITKVYMDGKCPICHGNGYYTDGPYDTFHNCPQCSPVRSR